MKIKQLIGLLIIGCCAPLSTVYAVPLGIYPIEHINFGELTPLTGRCSMDHLTGTVINVLGDNCKNIDTSRGLYRIVAEKNTLIRVTVFSRLNLGDGIEFRPSGTISSSEWSTVISPGSFIDIDSGPSGWIDITLGGQLLLHSPQAPGSEIAVDFNIEYIPTP